MKRFGIIALLFACVMIVAFVAQAADTTTVQSSTQDYRMQIGNKAERGAMNVLFGWTEIPKRVVDLTKETKNPIWGLLVGTMQGTGKAFARTASGVVDVATCGVKSDEKPFVQPDMNTTQEQK